MIRPSSSSSMFYSLAVQGRYPGRNSLSKLNKTSGVYIATSDEKNTPVNERTGKYDRMCSTINGCDSDLLCDRWRTWLVIWHSSRNSVAVIERVE